MNKIEAKTLPGFMELLPNEQILFNQMRDKIKLSYEKFGFLPIDTPVIEDSKVLLAKAGSETDKQLYSFTKGDSNLILRFDLTVPLAKYVTEYYNQITFPFRRYQIGKVYRGEKSQRGRYREFYQCDIDIIGDGKLNIINDAEIPAIIYETFKNLGIKNFSIHINNRKILNGVFEAIGIKSKTINILRMIDKKEKIGQETVIKIFKDDYGISKENIEKIIDFINITGTTDKKLQKLDTLNINNNLYKEGVQELKDVIKFIRCFNIPEKAFEIDLGIARGLDYYTGTVYETFLNDYKFIGSICSGGRYNDLARYYTERKLPGVGMSIGLTRLFFILNEVGLLKVEKKSISDVLVISLEENFNISIKIANELRKAGINTEIFLDNKKIKSKFKYADKLQIPYVIIIGEDEIKSGLLTIKDMKNGVQEQKTINDIIKMLK